MGFFNEKKRASPYVSPALSQEPPRHSGFAPAIPDLEEKDSKYKKSIRILRFVTRLLSVILNALVIGVLSFSLFKYFTTKSHPISSTNASHPWAEPATLWPTFVLLGIAVVTFFMNFFTLLAYCCGVGAANKVNSCSTVVSYIFLGVHVLLWVMATGAFKLGSNGKDLWGYSCSSEADKLQAEVKSFVDFGKLCTMQTGAWYVSILETAVYLLTFIVTILTLCRASQKKKLGKMRENMNMEAGYDRVELGSVYKQGRRYMPLAGESPSLR